MGIEYTKMSQNVAFFVTLSLSGPICEDIWPMCSNKTCSLHSMQTFFRGKAPETEDVKLLLKKARKEQSEDLFKGPEEIKK